jgi:hypothetical protein
MAKKKKRVANVEITVPPPLEDEESRRISFSFVHVTDNDADFSVRYAKNPGYVEKLIARLKRFSDLENRHLNANKDGHTHPIDWGKTSKKGFGFKGLKTQYDGYEPWQISIEEGIRGHQGCGRIHGFFIGNIFYVRWFDPGHKLYPGK